MRGWSVLSPAVEEAIQDLAEDHTSGASHVARVALQTMALLSTEANGRPDREALEEAARRISAAHPAMAVVHNVVHLYAQLVKEGHDPRAAFDQIGFELESARERVAGSFLKIAPGPGDVVTVSYSDNVLACVQAAAKKGRIGRVHVMESRPLMEGRFLVVALTEAGVPAVLVPDALGPSLVASSACVLVGADSVLRDGSVVNKIGTYALALAAAEAERPVFVACETLKFDARYDAATWPGSPAMSPEELWSNPPERIDVMNRHFEVTPAKLITMIATERGSLAPDVVRTMLAQSTRRR